jgi:hypothetical protein
MTTTAAAAAAAVANYNCSFNLFFKEENVNFFKFQK